MGSWAGALCFLQLCWGQKQKTKPMSLWFGQGPAENQVAPAVGSVPLLSFAQRSAVLWYSAPADLAAKNLQLSAETLSVSQMVRGTGGSFSSAVDGFMRYCSFPYELPDV